MQGHFTDGCDFLRMRQHLHEDHEVKKDDTTHARGGIIRPRIQVLDGAQTDGIHQDVLRILDQIGIRVTSDKARRLFQRAGAVCRDGDIVHLPPALVEDSLKSAPPSVDIHDRRGALKMHLPSTARFGPGVTCLYFQDPKTNALIPFGRREIAASVRLGRALDQFDFMSTPGVLQDACLADKADVYTALEMIANTDKPLVLLVSRAEALAPVLDLLTELHGDLAEKPFALPLLTPITPLVIDAETCSRMFTAIAYGLPVVYVNYGMAGVNAPITPYGTLAQLMAEIVAGISLSQVIKRGTPIIAGCLGAYMDMRTTVNFYDPVSYLLNLACAEMMAFYRIPHYGNSGNAVGWGADLISAGHQWFNHITACLGTSGMAAFVGTVLTSKVFSPGVVVYADEVIAQARRFAAGFNVDESALLLHELSLTGPGGNFLSSDMTLRRFREAYFQSAVFPRISMEDWLAQGQPAAEERLRQYTAQVLQTAKPPEDHDDLMERGEAFLNRQQSSVAAAAK